VGAGGGLGGAAAAGGGGGGCGALVDVFLNGDGVTVRLSACVKEIWFQKQRQSL
jgi:hypothetical protein